MAMAKERSDWARTAVMTSWLIAAFNGQQIAPFKIIPPQFRPPLVPERAKSPEQRADESKRAWHVLDRYFGKA